MFEKTMCYQRLAVVVSITLLLSLPALAFGATYYVDAGSGTDAGDCSTACKTITYAAANVPAGTSGAPNVISVAAGTYDGANTEVFPIAFANNYVSLTGAGSGTTTIDAGGAVGLDVDAMGFSVSGFTFQNATDGIDISEGGFTISNNIFETTVDQGIYFYRSDTDLSTSVTFPDMSITGNTFKTITDGVYVNVVQDFDDTTENLTAAFGNLSVTNNTFPVTGGDGIHVSELFDIDDMLNGTVTAGNFTVTGNTFTGGSRGMYFYGSIYYVEDTQITVGNFVVSNNTCTNQSSRGLYIDYWDMGNFYGSTSAVFGDLTVSDNTVTATDYVTYPNTSGIYLSDLDYIENIYDQSTVSTGTINVTGNTVDVDEYGLYFYSYGIYDIGEEYYLDSASVMTGPRNVSNNTFNSNANYGVYFDMEYVAYDMYGATTVTYGAINFTNNTVTSYNEALYFYIYEWGYYMIDDSSATHGDWTITGNTLTSSNSAAVYYYIDEYGIYNEGNSVFTGGNTNISNNTLNGTYGLEGYPYYIGYENYDASVVNFGDFTFSDNTVTATSQDAFYMYFYENAYYLYDDAVLNMGSFTLNNNTFTATSGYGVYLYYDEFAYYTEGGSSTSLGSFTISNNTITSDDEGLYLYYDEFGYELEDQSSFTVGNFAVNNNTITSNNDDGLYLYFYYFAYYMYNDTTFTMNTFTINNNTIDSKAGGDGIYIEYYEYYVASYLEDDARVILPDWNITNNSIDSANDGYGIYFYTYSNPDDNYGRSYSDFGNWLIDGNTFNPNKDAAMDYGIYMYIEDMPEGFYGSGTTIFGNVTITNNNFYNIEDYGIYFEVDEFSYDHYGPATSTFGDIKISNNMMDMVDYGIYVLLYDLSSQTSGTVTFGDLDVQENTLTKVMDTGIYVEYYNYNDDPDTASLTIGRPSIYENTITGNPGTGDGIYLEVDNSTDGITFGTPIVKRNMVSAFDTGLYLDTIEDGTFTCNRLLDNTNLGVRVTNTDGTGLKFEKNAIFNNTTNGMAIDNGNAAEVMAELNWWGDAAGPAACASCNGVDPGDSGTVDFTPWLTSDINANCGNFPWVMFAPATTGMGPAAP